MSNKDNGGPASDRELLEMAAKAAGEDLDWYESGGYFYRRYCNWPDDKGFFNPFNDDGEALRLAVKVGIDVDQYGDRAETWKAGLDGFIVEPYSGDPYAATRRAIVRAAAAIGSAM